MMNHKCIAALILGHILLAEAARADITTCFLEKTGMSPRAAPSGSDTPRGRIFSGKGSAESYGPDWRSWEQAVQKRSLINESPGRISQTDPVYLEFLKRLGYETRRAQLHPPSAQELFDNLESLSRRALTNSGLSAEDGFKPVRAYRRADGEIIPAFFGEKPSAAAPVAVSRTREIPEADYYDFLSKGLVLMDDASGNPAGFDEGMAKIFASLRDPKKIDSVKEAAEEVARALARSDVPRDYRTRVAYLFDHLELPRQDITAEALAISRSKSDSRFNVHSLAEKINKLNKKRFNGKDFDTVLAELEDLYQKEVNYLGFGQNSVVPTEAGKKPGIIRDLMRQAQAAVKSGASDEQTALALAKVQMALINLGRADFNKLIQQGAQRNLPEGTLAHRIFCGSGTYGRHTEIFRAFCLQTR